VGAEQELILIDTNIFVIDLRYTRDTNYKVNQAFLTSVAKFGNGFTTIVNLLELCGILSFNLNRDQLLDLWHYFYDRYKITILPEPELQSTFPGLEISQLFNIMSKKSSFGDALMIAVAKRYLSFVSTMVTWDNEHFKGKYSGKVLTPKEYLTEIT
jgi:predicted nucleic acid-binding protein